MDRMLTSRTRAYVALLLAVVIGWLWVRTPALAAFASAADGGWLLSVTALYLCSHVFRIMRLVLLTLDRRDKAFALVAAHTLTAFPSSFLPLKIGEILRLGAFFQVYGSDRRKALAVWLAERFGDVVVIAGFIFALYLFNVGVPRPMRVVFVTFLLAAIGGLFALFAVAKVSLYLNRHLVLASHRPRGLALLRASHALRRLEQDIRKSVEGRLAAILLFSALIWTVEILALSLFVNQFTRGEPDFTSLFTAGLLASVLGGDGHAGNSFGLYQSLGLVVLTLTFLAAALVAARSRHSRQ
jgi:hypothetical protein